ncbi:hypothetical protein Trco_007323 [Trichoderma cornu-damae]|uniref:Peptidase C14 caspase domain-containing protein n=1 Tax=Trichoderma cornu-damae TaxID=654480 RepID=A0A9P8TTB9_9HYPO|nr:hypothetical protein Trco_007323 [Trichoderma cornu-damae]
MSSSSKHFAVLIGVDLYMKKPLYSCVRDVVLVEGYLQHLEQTGRINWLQITKLTASHPSSRDGDDKTLPPESDETLPTTENIKKRLSKFMSDSTPGDHVLVHFSGHGTVLPDGRFALVPFRCEDGNNGQLKDLLAGDDLANLLHEMTEKGAKVLLVLDCCFSGKISRSRLPDAVRYMPLNPLSDTHRGTMEEAGQSALTRDATFRGASTRENWLMDTTRYTILTACSPTQTTHAVRFSREELHDSEPWDLAQVPQLRGSSDFAFFAHLQGEDDSFFPIAMLPSGRIMLQAGQIMGVCENDELALSPLSPHADKIWDSKYQLATARNVGGVTAEVKLNGSGSGLIDYNWVARLSKLCAHSSGDNETPVEESQGLPEHSLGVASARSRILRGLAHLARFDDIAHMKPRKEDEVLQNAVDVKLYRKPRLSLPHDVVIDAAHEETLSLSVFNNGERRVFVDIYCLTGEWEIENLLAAENTELASQEAAEQDRRIELDVKMMVPEHFREATSCEDVFKVFIITRNVPFNLAALGPSYRGPELSWEDELPDSWMAPSEFCLMVMLEMQLVCLPWTGDPMQ